MKVTSVLFMAVMAVASVSAAALPEPEADYNDACYSPDGACTKLTQAISAARGTLAVRSAGEHSPESKRAEEYLITAIKQAEDPDTVSFTKREALPEARNPFCPWVGAPCLKVRRAAEAINTILGDENLQKRWADPEARNVFCPWVGAPCLKARRSIDSLLDASQEVLKTLRLK
jgi:hypothetical protein